MKKTCLMLVCCALGSLTLPVAGQEADIEAGVQWLIDRQQSGDQPAAGVHRPTDITSRVQVNTQAWRTAQTLERTDQFDPLASTLSADIPAGLSLPELAALATVRLDAGLSATAAIEQLLDAQLTTGGFPSHAGFRADPLTTALTLRLLARAGRDQRSEAAAAVGFLLQTQNSDGGWRPALGSASSVNATARIAEVLVGFRNRFELTTPLSAARGFLMDNQRADGSLGDIFETASAAIALLAVGAERDAVQPSIDWLIDRQQANGAFADDAYHTALALRALGLWAQPVSSPELSGLSARVVAADTLLPIAGAELILSGTDSANLVSNSEGTLFSTQLLPGPYQARVEFPGMQTVEFEFSLLPGKLSDLGELRLSQAGSDDSPLGVIRGRITASESGSPIAGAEVSIQPNDRSATTDADGRFQILQVQPGPLDLAISAAGFSRQTASVTLDPGGTIEFSVELTAVASPTGAAVVRGSVRSGQTDEPLSDVVIEITDAGTGDPLSDTVSATDGSHEQAVDFEGEVDIVASAAGLDPVEITAALMAGQVFEFSPAMYPEGETPPGANRSRIVGTVVSQANREPIENARLTVTDGMRQQTVRSGGEGRFVIEDLVGPNVSIEIAADAFDSTRLLVPLLPLQTRDIGTVSLKPTTLQFFFPDLVITATSLTRTDPDSFEMADEVLVEVTNQGTSGLQQDFDLQAFIDANGDGLFDPDREPLIGSRRITDDLPIGASTEVRLAVEARLAFRDAPFALVVDPLEEVPEQDEENNAASTLLGCRATPAFIGDDGIEEAWRWSGLSSNPDINSISQVPAVGQLSDDNGDGVINQFDIPDIVFVAGRRNSNAPTQTALVAISGDDGRELWSRTDIRLSHFSSPALGDLDNDGIAEIVVVRNYREEILAFENDGELKWRTGIDQPKVPKVLFPPPPHVYDMPIIVNLEGDNEAEVILGRQAFRGLTGERLWEGEFDGGGIDGGVPVLAAFSQSAVAADVDLDGITEVIAGRTLYDHEGNAVWFRDDIKSDPTSDEGDTEQHYSGYVGIGNFDLDDFAEIVLSVHDELHLLEHTGETIWGPVNAPDFTEMAAPTIVDLDDDGLPEIIVSSKFRLTVFETDGTVKWTADIEDPSGITSATTFDFENDGLLEIMHIDETDFRIFDALTGVQLFETRHTSPTVFEYPVVADVDGDKQAEILLTGTDRDLQAGVTPGLRVFKARDGAWADAGSVWGSHAFHIDDIGEDSIIPLIETPSWLTHNTYRVQRSPLPDPLGRPDFTLGDLRLIDQGPGNNPVVQVRIGNAGPVDAHQPPTLGLFRGDPQNGGVLVAEQRLDTLRPNRFQVVNLGAIPVAGSGELFAVIDHPGIAEECREDNNRRSIPFAAINGRGSLQLETDAAEYPLNAEALFTARVANLGGIPADYEVRLRLADSEDNIVASFEPTAFVDLDPGNEAAADQPWRASDVLGGSYSLRGELLDLRGDVIDTDSVDFAIGETSGPAGRIDLQMEQSEFRPGEIATIEIRARNISDDTPIQAPRIDYTISGPAGEAASGRIAFDDLLPGGVADFEVIAEGTQATGAYTVTAVLRSTLTGQQLASDSTVFTRLDAPSDEIRGVVDAALRSLVQGQSQRCIFNLRNLGPRDLNGLVIRKRFVRVADGQAMQSVEENIDLPSGADNVSVEQADTGGFTPGEHLCTLELGPGPDWIPLDAGGFAVQAPAVAGIEVTPTSGLATSEGGGSASFSLVLTGPPSAGVTVPLEVTDASEWQLSASSVTFSVATWDLPRTVVVSGVDDDTVDGTQTGRIGVLPAQSDDPAYSGLDPTDPEVSNLDDDAPAIRVAPQSVTTSEDGTSETISISINAQPSAPVAIALQNPDADEWQIEPTVVEFTPADWQTARNVVVTGVDDTAFDGEQSGVIEIGPARSDDPAFDGLEAADVAAVNLDNEQVAIHVEPDMVTTTEGGQASQFTVRLAARPTGEVVIPVGIADAGEWQVMAVDVRLDQNNWDAGQSVAVLPVDDDEIDGTEIATLPLAAAVSQDARYAGIDPGDVTLVNHDNDGTTIVVTPTAGLIVGEDGATDTFTVHLTRAPEQNVTVPVVSADPGEFSVSPQVLEFTPQQGTTPHTLTITGVDDDIADGNITGRIRLGTSISEQPAFNGIDPPDVSVTNIDDEVVAITVQPDDVVQTDEAGASGQVRVSLNHAPTREVTVDLAVSDPGEWRLDTNQLRFTPTDWTPREITVTGVDDDVVDGAVTGSLVLSPAASEDNRYAGLEPRDVALVNLDNDAAGDPDPAPPLDPIPVPLLDRWLVLLLALSMVVGLALRTPGRARPTHDFKQQGDWL